MESFPDFQKKRKNRCLLLLTGLLGCLCFGTGDWLMLFADATAKGKISWLTVGAAQIAPWRFTIAMILAFPGILAYALALFGWEAYIPQEKDRRLYHVLNIVGLLPWIALHLFYILILSFFGSLCRAGEEALALRVCEEVFSQFQWLPLVSEAFMLPVFLFWSFLLLRKKTLLPRGMILTHVLVFYCLLSAFGRIFLTGAFQLGFRNGLMSESMALSFLALLLWEGKSSLSRER